MRLEVFVLSEIQIRARLCNFLFTCSRICPAFDWDETFFKNDDFKKIKRMQVNAGK